MNATVTIRDARPADADQIADYYRYYAEETAINFESAAPEGDEFRRRIAAVQREYPFLVAVDGAKAGADNGRVVGYIFGEALSGRPAFLVSALSSIYLDREVRGHGIGRALYAALEERLVQQNVAKLFAYITCAQDDALADLRADFTGFTPGAFRRAGAGREGVADFGATEDSGSDPHLPRTSPRFHSAIGFSVVGRQYGCGYKFSTWYDKVYMEKSLIDQPATIGDFIPYPQTPAGAALAL